MIVLSRFRFFVLSLITNCLFLSVRKTNRINPLVIISSKLPAITNEITMGVADYSKTKVPHFKSTDLNRIQVTYTLTCCNIQVTQPYCTMLATVTGNCDVTNV